MYLALQHQGKKKKDSENLENNVESGDIALTPETIKKLLV